MSIPKEKQFLPERVPVRFGWHKLQPWGLLLCRLSPLGRTVLQVGRVPLDDRWQGTPLHRFSREGCHAGNSSRPFGLLRNPPKGVPVFGPKQAAAPSQGRAGLVLGVLRPWSGWPAGGRWFGRGMLELRQSKTGEQGRTGEQTGEQIAIFWRFSLEKLDPAAPTIF